MLVFSKLVKPEDLNPANTLFGGTLMSWIDEGCALYAMNTLKTKRIVTLKVSELLFKTPARQGDIVEVDCTTEKIGTTSLTVFCRVLKEKFEEEKEIISECTIVFVAVDEDGKPTAHGKGAKWKYGE